MTTTRIRLALAMLVAMAGCELRDADGSRAAATAATTPSAEAGIDSMNARLERAYHARDPRAYGALFTDSATFEWPAVATVRGRPALEAMARDGWTSLPDLELRVIVSNRRVSGDRATEFGAFEESWRDSTGGRTTEFGRYAVALVRGSVDGWRMDRFMGFSDSTRTASGKR